MHFICFNSSSCFIKNKLFVYRQLVVALASFSILIACYPILKRSLWLDEVMLLSNYPLKNISDIFHPLPLYDQATTPIYSLLMSLMRNLNSELVRGFSVYFITYLSINILLYNSKRLGPVFITTIIVTLFLPPLIMLSELKHYGLEIVGTLIGIMWFVERNPENPLSIEDVGILIISMLLGISTIIISSLAIISFVSIRLFRERKIILRELWLAALFTLLVLGYYLIVKNVTSIQVGNYSDVYIDKGGAENVKLLLRSLYSNAGLKGGFVLLLSVLILLLNLKNKSAQKLLIFSLLVTVTFSTITFAGIYPVSNSKHVTFFAAFFWSILFYAFSCTVECSNLKYVKTVTYSFITTCILLSARNVFDLWHVNIESTNNKEAISFLRSLPPSKVGLWIGGQPVIQFYSVCYPDLNKHTYFGLVNPRSAPLRIDRDNQDEYFENIENTRNEPGAWGRMVSYRMILNFIRPARSLISEAPQNTQFYIFASHYDSLARGGSSMARVDALQVAFREHGCRSKLIKEFKNVSFYEAFCTTDK